MSDKEQAEAFAHELDKLVERFEHEFQMLAATAIGVMEIKKHALIANLFEDDE